MQVQLKTTLAKTGVQSKYGSQYICLWVACFITLIGIGLTMPQVSVRVVDKGLSLQEFGIIQAVATLLSVFTQVGIGKYSDRIGKRKPLVIGALLLLTPVMFIFPRAETALAFGILLSLAQVGLNTVSAISATWISGWATDGNMGRLHGSFRTAYSFGWVLATASMGTLLDNLGFSSTFYIASIAFVMAICFVLLGTKDQVLPMAHTVTPNAEKGVSKSYRWPRALKVVFISLGVFILAQSMGLHLNYIFFAHEIGVTNQQFGLLSSIQAWPEIPMMLFFGVVADRLQGSKLLAIGMVIAGLRWILLAFATTSWHLFLIQPIHAVGMTVSDVLLVVVIARMVPTKYLGAVMGWKITVMSVARFLAPLLAGYVGDYLGIRVVFALSGLIALLSGAVIMQMTSKRENLSSSNSKGSR